MDDRTTRVHVATVRINQNAKRASDPEDGYIVVLSDGTELIRSHWIGMGASERAEYLGRT